MSGRESPALRSSAKSLRMTTSQGLVARHIRRAPIFEIERSCFIYAIEEHERVGAVRVEPCLLGSKRDCLVGSFECDVELTGQDEIVS
jgi:hypothetical protein